MTKPLPIETRRPLAWRDPLTVAASVAEREGALALISDGGALGRRSFIAAEPDEMRVVEDTAGNLSLLNDPAFARSTVALLAYDAGAKAATGPRPSVWPDLMLARYPAMLVFDHLERNVEAMGYGEDEAAAEAAVARAVGWWNQAVRVTPLSAPCRELKAEAPPAAYLDAVADVTARIAAGELFQANIARAWTGKLEPGRSPLDVLIRLAGREAAYGAYWRIGDLAIVSNSPELFLTFDPGSRRLETRPIKGTRRRHANPSRDAALAAELAASAKDRAENLMIVDLMRNDLARVAEPGTIQVPAVFEVERHPTVHHLVSTVSARARDDVGPADILSATFPPGSITGAPKHQAMKVIAAHEPPRGPWCGSLLHLDEAGRMTASVLIRTVSFTRDDAGWSLRTLAGAGVVADSDPAAELDETDAKIAALREALTDRPV